MISQCSSLSGSRLLTVRCNAVLKPERSYSELFDIDCYSERSIPVCSKQSTLIGTPRLSATPAQTPPSPSTPPRPTLEAYTVIGPRVGISYLSLETGLITQVRHGRIVHSVTVPFFSPPLFSGIPSAPASNVAASKGEEQATSALAHAQAQAEKRRADKMASTPAHFSII